MKRVLVISISCVGFLFSVPANDAGLVISEILASNSGGLRDEDGDYSDWIEVFNNSANAANMEGWHLTDDPDQPIKWKFPNVVLQSQRYVVVFASEKDKTAPDSQLHTNFRLNANGEYLALVEPDGTTIAFEYGPEFPLQVANVSYGIIGNSNRYFSKPTPGRVNGAGFLGFAPELKLSHTRGFFDSPFDLTLGTATAEAVIRYTFNGEPPSANTGFVYSGPIPINRTTTLRAAAFNSGYSPSRTKTHTFIYLEDVIRQSPAGKPPDGWPASWGGNVRDYGIDPDVVNNTLYRETIVDDLKSIPTFSIVMDLDDLFDRTRGIYANPGQDGRAWERPASIELIHPGGEKGFQIEGGIRIRGGFSRSTNNPKHAFRLFFREEYGESKLRYPLFGETGADEFDNVDLRTFQNYSWSFQGDSRGIFIRDQFSRDTQLAMMRPTTRGEFYHLYINGQYWGLYNTQERSEASYAETYFGGRKEDYDVIKVEAGPYTINATDGNLNAWRRLYDLARAGLRTEEAYQRIQGNNSDGTRNPDYEVLLDVRNLIDYMLVIFYGGNLDAPISNFLGNTRPNNWYGIRNRIGDEGFRFFAHDSEHTLLNLNENRTGPFPAGDSSVNYSSPQYLWKRLQANPEFKLLVADHIQRHFFNEGALTPEAVRARFLARKEEIDRAVVAESARWGDSKRSRPFTRTDWLSAINGILRNYVPQRSSIVVNQLRADGFVPATAAPVLSQHGGVIQKGYGLTITAPSGRIYFTRDGNDPRRTGGDVSSSALTYSRPLRLDESVVVSARALNNGIWSPLIEAEFTVSQDFAELLITEIMYHPPDRNGVDGDRFEFIELKNVGTAELDLSGVHFTSGIDFSFPVGSTLGPGRFAVLVRDPVAFLQMYPDTSFQGVFLGSLSNSGERVTVVHAIGTEIGSVTYGDANLWPSAADGGGFSLVPINPNAIPDWSSRENWRASSRVGGSPGFDDSSVSIDTVWISEVLPRAIPPQENLIELYNPTDRTVDLTSWFLSDERTMPKKYGFPIGTAIPAGGHLVMIESEFLRVETGFPEFRLNEQSKAIFLHSGDSSGELTGYSDAVYLEAGEEGVSFGRLTVSTGETHLWPQLSGTFGAANAELRIGPVVINEIHYHPPVGEVEFIELKNISNDLVRLDDSAGSGNAWRLKGLSFEFPVNTEIPVGGLLLITGSDPDLFRSKRGIPASVPVLGPFQGVLQNNGELLELQRPFGAGSGQEGANRSLYVNVDAVRYDNQVPWPIEPAGRGASLERRISSAYGNDPINWRASPGGPSPGLNNNGNRSPQVNAGPDLSSEASIFPVTVELAGTTTDDGFPEQPGVLTISWVQVSGPVPIVFRDSDSAASSADFPTSGQYGLRLVVSDGELIVSDDVTVKIDRTPMLTKMVPSGSVWRYLDNGSNQGSIWRSPGFGDSSWRSGKAQLGYGDGDEASVIRFGPDSGNKYVASYFRHSFVVNDAGMVAGLTFRLLRDDGAIVYLNGREVVRSNMPDGAVHYRTFARNVVGNADESAFFEQEVDPSFLRNGSNTLAVEVHQANASSSDISFDLELVALRAPGNQRPVVNAGPDLTVSIGSIVTLRGVAGDDGLPVPPGLLDFSWTQVSGPGEVVIEESGGMERSATFTHPGAYVLRFAADDGEFLSEDLTLVTVTDSALRSWRSMHFDLDELNDLATSGDSADPDLDGHSNFQEYVSGTDPRNGRDYLRIEIAESLDGGQAGIRFQFQALSGRWYTLQVSDSLASSEWFTLQQFAPEPATRRIDVSRLIDVAEGILFFRVVASQRE